MDNTEVNISQEIPAYERRYRKISEWFLNCKPAYAILKFIYKYMAYFIAFAYIFLIIMSLRGTFFSETTPIMLRNSGIVVETPAYERRYRKISEWFLNCKPAYAILKFIYKYMAYFIAFAYIFLIIMSLRGTFFSETTPIMLRNSGIVVETDKFLLTSKLILTPLTSFILVSVIRKCIDAKRPYEKYNIKPLFIKETKGESMPSRHVFSITIIAMCWLYVSVPVGIIMLMLVAIMATSRVLAGVHFVRDVVVGFAVGIICGIAGLWII